MTTSSRIGEKLLAGWTLLGECCPSEGCATPLLRARTPGAKLYCPQHDGFVDDAAEPAAAQPSGGATYDAAEHEDSRLGPYAKAAAQAQAPPDAAPPPASSTPGRTEKKADAIIADYLLDGWTMLGEACPIPDCYSPLMWQKKERKKFCPVHQLYVMSDAEAGRAADKPQGEAAAAEADSAAAAPPSKPQEAPPAPDAEVARTVAASVPVLLFKIGQATETMKAATKANLILDMVKVITECATAIKALREL